VKFDAVYLQRISHETGFDAVNLEKVLRLKRLLIEFASHPFLKDRLVLKGGTAVNLFFQELLRLSVDIDLNYIGVLDREGMLYERVELAKHIEQICATLKLQKPTGRRFTRSHRVEPGLSESPWDLQPDSGRSQLPDADLCLAPGGTHRGPNG
jgi:predicted nucleotidyltransferase component of viral defense system